VGDSTLDLPQTESWNLQWVICQFYFVSLPYLFYHSTVFVVLSDIEFAGIDSITLDVTALAGLPMRALRATPCPVCHCNTKFLIILITMMVIIITILPTITMQQQKEQRAKRAKAESKEREQRAETWSI